MNNRWPHLQLSSSDDERYDVQWITDDLIYNSRHQMMKDMLYNE